MLLQPALERRQAAEEAQVRGMSLSERQQQEQRLVIDRVLAHINGRASQLQVWGRVGVYEGCSVLGVPCSSRPGGVHVSTVKLRLVGRFLVFYY